MTLNVFVDSTLLTLWSVKHFHAPTVTSTTKWLLTFLVFIPKATLRSLCVKYVSHKHTDPQKSKAITKVSTFFIYHKYSMHCQATINITVLKFKAEVLWYITYEHLHIQFLQLSQWCSCKHFFSILSTCTLDIYRHVYLHSIFLQSIEKINSIAFIVTLCIITLCISVCDRANVHDLPFVAFCLQLKRLSNLWSSCPQLSLQLSRKCKAPVPLFSCCKTEYQLQWQGKKETHFNNCWDAAFICSKWQLHHPIFYLFFFIWVSTYGSCHNENFFSFWKMIIDQTRRDKDQFWENCTHQSVFVWVDMSNQQGWMGENSL